MKTTLMVFIMVALMSGCRPCKYAITINANDATPPLLKWVVDINGVVTNSTGGTITMREKDTVTIMALATDFESGIDQLKLSGSSSTTCKMGSEIGQNAIADYADQKVNGFCAENKSRSQLSVSLKELRFMKCNSGFSFSSASIRVNAVVTNGVGQKTAIALRVESE